MSIHKFIYVCAVATLSLGIAQAQGRIAQVLEATPDLRAAAMGHSTVGNTREMHLYTNPASILSNGQRLSLDLSAEYFPDSEYGRLKQYNVSLAYRTSKHFALLAGWRRLSGLSVPTTTGRVGETHIKPYGQTFDLGATLAVAPSLSIYASASILDEYVGTRAKGVALSVGASYQRRLDISATMPSLLVLGIRLQDVGKPVQFDGTKLPYNLPTSLVVGGEWGVALAPKHQVAYALSTRVFTGSKEDKEYHLSTGLEYCYNHSLSARLGYRYARQGADMLTFGLGYELSARYRLNVAYNHAPALYGVDRLLVGIGFSL